MRGRISYRLLVLLLVVGFAGLLPVAAHAQEPDVDDDDDVLIHINGDSRVGPEDDVDTLVVINGDATIDGAVKNAVVVIHGDATVSGSIGKNLTVVDGDINLLSGAQVKDVNSVRGNLNRDAAATVSGDVHERDNFEWGGFGVALFSIWFWVALTIIFIVGGLVFAAVGGRQLKTISLAMTGQFVNTVVGGVFLWIALPILAVIVMLTVVGILLGVAVFLFLLPALWFLGYLAAGTRLGLAIVGWTNRPPGDHPYAAAALGIFILQLIALIPFIGWLIAFIAGLWGAAALAYVAFAAAGGKSFEGTRTPPAATAP